MSATTILNAPTSAFRPIKKLSTGDGTTFLCLPRRIEQALKHDTRSDEHYDECPSHNNVVKTLKRSKASKLDYQHLRLLPQLFIVKMHVSPQTLRKELGIIESFHGRHGSSPRDDVVGSVMIQAQVHDSEILRSWICLRPIFGHTLIEFGVACKASVYQGIPSYFVWHIFLGLLKAVEFIHEAGTAHNDICALNVMLNPYPERLARDGKGELCLYPDVVLIDFHQASTASDVLRGRDAKALLELIEEVVREWSDLSPSIDNMDLDSPHCKSLARFHQEVGDVLARHEDFTVARVRHEWGEIAEAGKKEAPYEMPTWMRGVLHNDLATAEELDKAVKEKMVTLKLKGKVEDLRRLDKGDRWNEGLCSACGSRGIRGRPKTCAASGTEFGQMRMAAKR